MVAMKRGTPNRRLRRERMRAALFAMAGKPLLLRPVHWQNYGYHGCGERGKQKDESTIQCGINGDIARAKNGGRRSYTRPLPAGSAMVIVILRW